MKLGDLARSSRNPTSFMPAFHVFRSRFRNRETSRCSRKSYESVHRSPSAPHLLTLPQQTAMVSLLSILRHPCHPGSLVTFPIRTHHGDRDFHKRTCHRPASTLHLLIFGQNQKKVYREVLIAGDLTPGEVYTMESSILLEYSGSMSDTAQLFYGNDAVYFAEPSLSQFVPGDRKSVV